MNIIIFEIDETKMSSATFLEQLSQNQVSIIGMGQGKLRIVTHLDYTDDMHAHFLKILNRIGWETGRWPTLFHKGVQPRNVGHTFLGNGGQFGFVDIGGFCNGLVQGKDQVVFQLLFVFQ